MFPRPKKNRPNRPGCDKVSTFLHQVQERTPTYAERQIEDKHVGVKMLLIVAIASGREVGRGRAPRVWSDSIFIPLGLGRSGPTPWPEPNLDAILLATCEGIDSTSNRVETFTVGNRLGILGSTTLVIIDRGVTVHRDSGSASAPISHPIGRLAEGPLTQSGICSVAWYNLGGYATKSDSV